MTVTVPRDQGADTWSLADLLDFPSLHATRLEVPAWQSIYLPVDPARNLFVVLEGQVRTHQVSREDSRRLIEILGPRDWFGAAALAGLPHYGEAAEAAVRSTVAILPVEHLLPVMAQQPTAALGFIRQMAMKLQALREEASGLVFDDCNQRLVRTLVRLSDSPAASPTADGVVLHITHQQLAQAVGVARETVSLALSQLRRRNLLRTGRNQLTFNPAHLEVTIGEVQHEPHPT